MPASPRHLLSLLDLTPAETARVLELAHHCKRTRGTPLQHSWLQGRAIGMLFASPTFRTSVTFSLAAAELGAIPVNVPVVLGEREPIRDTARNLAGWVHAVVARVPDHAALQELARWSTAPVINALSPRTHPCEVLSEAMTLQEHKGDLHQLRLAFVGSGNLCNAWFELAANTGLSVTQVCPPGYEVDQALLGAARQRSAGELRVTSDAKEGLEGADVVYTDTWPAGGDNSAFRPYQVTQDLMRFARPDAVFMHCLPARRGEEVTDAVLEGPQSIVFQAKQNLLHLHKAVLLSVMSGADGLLTKDAPILAGNSSESVQR